MRAFNSQTVRAKKKKPYLSQDGLCKRQTSGIDPPTTILGQGKHGQIIVYNALLSVRSRVLQSSHRGRKSRLFNFKSNIRAPVLLNLLNSLRKRDKMLDKSRIYLFSPTRLINSIKHEYSCKILYLSTAASVLCLFLAMPWVGL